MSGTTLGFTNLLLGGLKNEKTMKCSAQLNLVARTAVSLILAGLVCNNAYSAAPAPPELFVSIGGTRVYLTWNAVDGADGYTLLYAPYPSAEPVSSINLGNSTFISEILPIGSAYYVALQSYNLDGANGYSNIEHFDIQDWQFKSPYFEFSIEEGIDPASAIQIRDAAIRTESFFRSQGLSLQGKKNFIAYRAHDGRSAYASRTTVYINLDSDTWTTASDSFRAVIVAHELFHTLQSQVTYYSEPIPEWLFEGSAHYAGFLMSDWAGLFDINSELKEIHDRESRAANRPSLSELEVDFPLDVNPYNISLLAVRLLTEDISDLIAFYSAGSDGASWQEAFYEIFGRTVESFYEEFEAYMTQIPDY